MAKTMPILIYVLFIKFILKSSVYNLSMGKIQIFSDQLFFAVRVQIFGVNQYPMAKEDSLYQTFSVCDASLRPVRREQPYLSLHG